MNIRTSLALAALLIGSALVAQAFGLDEEAQRRLAGIMSGLVLAIFANSIPKHLPPLRGSKLSAARAQSYQRFAGWTFALAGLGHASVWLALPIHLANTMAIVIVGGAVLLVIATCLLARTGAAAD
ncbi:MAG: hypothetical protein GKS06_00605 [Acidobacteria bacterium]|nr:hypothetical protein [Acidobacteriota bacterium]